jgi:biopolymer transport protein ExbD
MRFRKENAKKIGFGSAVDLTPVVDTVFNLLIFFALSLNFAATSGGINVKLPKAGSAEPVKAEQLTINLTKDGKLYLNDKVITLERLSETLEKNQDKESLVIIRADSLVPHGRVVEVMDTVKTKGFSRLAIAVEQAPPKTEEK